MDKNTYDLLNKAPTYTDLSDIYHLLTIAEEQATNGQIMSADDSITKLREKYGL